MTATTTPPVLPFPTSAAARNAVRRVENEAEAETPADRAAVETAVTKILGDQKLEALDPRRVFGDGPIADHCLAVAAKFKIPATTCVLVALSLRSIGCADRVRLRVRDEEAEGGWFVTAQHVWACSELHASTGKSALFKDLGDSRLSGFNSRVKQAWSDVVLTDRVRRDAAIGVAKRKGATEGDKKAAARLRETPAHCVPDAFQDRTTVQDFRGQMLRAGFCYTVQAEGSEFFNQFVFETLAVNDLNDGFSGARGTASTKKERSEGGLPIFEEWHCTIAVSPQPGWVSPTNAKHRENLLDAAGRLGLLARFLCARGHEGTPAVCSMTASERGLASVAYNEDLARFLYVSPPVIVGEDERTPGLERHPLAPRRRADDGSQVYAGSYVDADGEAAERLLAYQREHKATQREINEAATKRGLRNDPRAALHGRIGELAMRVAGLLALIREGGVEAVLRDGVYPHVTLDEAERAIYLCDTLIPHAEHMLAEAVLGEVATIVGKVVRILAEHGRMRETRLWSSHLQNLPEEVARNGQAKPAVDAALSRATLYGFVVKEPGRGKAVYYDLSPSAWRAVRARRPALQEAA